MVRAFISYARADEKAARLLAADLEKRGVQVASIDHLVSPGEAWASQLQNTIASSDVVFVLVSPESLRSEYVSTETALAVSQAERGRTRVVPVLLDPKVESPALLQFVQAIEFFNPDQLQAQIDRLLQSIRSGPPPTEDQATQSLEANLNYVKAARRALQVEKSIQTSKQAAWSVTLGATVSTLAGGAITLALIIAFWEGAPATVRGWAAPFGLGIVASVLGFLVVAWLRRHWLKPRVPYGEPE